MTLRRRELQHSGRNLSPEQTRTLQVRVDRVIARTGGTQVAINQVAWDGGDSLIPLPGEKPAHELGVTPSARTVNGCEYYQFCTYGNTNFTGMVDRMQSCVLHDTHSGFLSYVNNQTPGTVATFYNHVVNYLTDTYPAFHKGTSLDYGPETY